MAFRAVLGEANSIWRVSRTSPVQVRSSTYLKNFCFTRSIASESIPDSGLPWKKNEQSTQRYNDQSVIRENPFKSLCKLTLIGRTGATPEIRDFSDGSKSMSLSIATNYSTGIGENASVETQWHRVYITESVPGFSFIKDLPVGTLLYIEGGMRVQTVERDGNQKQYVNVNVNRNQGTIRVLSTPSRFRSDSNSGDLPF